MTNFKNHLKAISHLEEALKNHREAAKYFEDGDHTKAYQNTLKASSHLKLATKAHNENLQVYQTIY